ncbi:hypothetical protein K439DRAFT_1347843 [Ramaria rubella]|nr:hypothetical protein K439DRAFT_1347843 [Ramaria rubella]
MGDLLTRVQVAQKVLELVGRLLGKNWVSRFLQKHQMALPAAKGQGLDLKHAQVFNPTMVGDHFKQLVEMIQEFDVPLENVYNWDEKGIQLGGGQKGLQGQFIFGVEDRERYIVQSESLELVSLWEAVNAGGSYVPPTFVIMKSAPPGWWEVQGIGGVKVTENGWTDNKTTLEWFFKVFVPHAKAQNVSGQWILLMFNRHHLHKTPQMLDTVFAYQVLLYCLLPHTTHNRALLDVSVFRPLQMVWLKHTPHCHLGYSCA